ncbi:neuroblast differentiation-associated protein AHNAK-like [Toxotes jaculatrix]|uniref:neuroblast differentiation-associated protein AHNAK-like n=1 Tax=Toxotes jaculatrix TaxID=941984 RepID=UPI001B3A91F5|nr:neuroblast differentiation-associated protein AHNAK-like [Toxotes jaculatrix]
MCDCFHLAFPNWHAASSGTAGRRLRGPEPGTEDDSVCDEPSQFTEAERPRPQGSSPVEEYPEIEKYSDSDKECEAEYDPHHKSGSGKKTKKSGLGSMFEKRSTPKMSKLKEAHSPESGLIVKTAKDGCAEGLIYGGGGKEGIFIKEVVPESPASKSLKLKEGDQILSATVYFDNVSYEDAIQILEHAQAYKVKLCLKRKPDITETEPAGETDVIPEEELDAPEIREQGKTKRRGDARISWPKFPSFGKGRKSRFTRSHSSSEADEQRKLELSPTTSDTESPIKSQDALKGKKRHKMKLSVLTKRGRISSSEDQDTDAPTGQTSGDHYQTASEMLSPECPESLTGEIPEDLKVEENLRPEQSDQKLTDPQNVHHKVELISLDSTLKTADLTVALADQESSSGIKSPSEKKKKKERSELKMKIMGKDKSHKKDAKAKASPKRLKTLGASFEIDQPENEKSDLIPGSESHTEVQGDQLPLDANTQIISSESTRAKSVTTQMEMSVPKVELVQKSPKKGEEKAKKGKDIKQKQGRKTSPTFKLPKIGLTDIAAEETIQKTNANVEESPARIEQRKSDGTEVNEDPYDRLSKSTLTRTQLPKREEIEIPGMEDMSRKITTKGMKEPKMVLSGHYEEIQAETVQLSIDVDSVKEAVSKLPGFKVPKVDTSGVPIPEEITVIDANAQRISVKTPTKVVDTKSKHDAHFTRFDVTASSEISMPTVKLPKITPADQTTEEPLTETKVDFEKHGKEHKTKQKQSDKELKTEVYKREDIVIPGKESAQEAILQAQGTEKTQEGLTFEYKGQTWGAISDVKIPEIDSIEYIDSAGGSPAQKDGGIRVPGFGVTLDATKPKADISFPETRSEVKDVALPKAKAEIKLPEAPEADITLGRVDVSVPAQKLEVTKPELEIKPLQAEHGQGSKFKMPKFGIKMPKIKGPEFDLSLSKKDGAVTLSEAKADVKIQDAPEADASLGKVDLSITAQKVEVKKPELEIKPLQTEGELDGQGSKFKMPKLGITMPKVKGPEIDFSLSKKDTDVTLPEAKAEVKLPAVELKDPSAKVEIKTPEIKGAEKDVEGSPSKFKMPAFKLPKFGAAAPNASFEVSSKTKDIQIPETQLKAPEGVDTAVDITASNIDMEGPSLDVKTTAADTDGKGSKFKMPKFGISLPKVKGPEIDLSLSKKDVDVTLPEAEVDVKLPEAEHTESGIKVDIKGPEIAVHQQDVEESPSKFKMPTFKLPKFGGGAPNVSVEVPDMDKDVKIDGADINISEEGPAVNIAVPSVDVEGPSIDVKTTGSEREGKGSKFKMPHLSFSMPKAKGPQISLTKKDVDVTLPEAKAKVQLPEAPEVDISCGNADVSIPEANLEVEQTELDTKPLHGEVEFDGQGSKFKMPKLGMSMPKVKGPEIHFGLSKKDEDVTLPEVKAEVKVPEVEIKEPFAKVDVKAPEAKASAKGTEGSPSKFKMPTFKLPKFGVGTPTVSVEVPDKDKDVKIDGADINISEEGSAVNIAVPSIEGPSIDVKTTGSEHEGKGSKFKMPHLSFSMPKVKGPKIDLSMPKKDVDITLPEAKADVKLPEVDLGEVDVSIPEAKVEVPEAEAEVRLPDAEYEAEMDGHEGNVKAIPPEVELKAPEGDAELDGQETKFKMPKFGISMSKVKGPDIDLSLSKKDVEVTPPKAKADFEIPEAPKIAVDVKSPEHEAEIDGQDSKFKMPKLGITMPKVKGPEIDLGLSKKDANVTLPEAKAEVKLPDVELKDPSAKVEIKAPEVEAQLGHVEGSPSKFKLPTFKLPKFGGASSNVTAEVPEMDKDINVDGAGLKIPKNSAAVDITAQSIDIEGPSLDVKMTGTEAEGKGSKFKMPKFGISLPKVRGPEIDLNLSKKDVDVTLPEAKAEVQPPDVKIKQPSAKVEIKAPEIEAQIGNVEGSPSKLKMPTFTLPKFGAATPKMSVPVPDVDKDIKIDGTKVEVLKAGATVDGTASSIDTADVKGSELEGSGSKFKMPQFGISIPKVKGPEIDLTLSKKDVDVTLPEAKTEVTLPSAEVKEPEGVISMPDAPTVEVETKLKRPNWTFPKFSFSRTGSKAPDVDVNIETPKADVTSPEVKAEVCLPDVEVKGTLGVASVEEAPAAELDASLKKPKFSLPRFSFSKPSVTVPEVSAELPHVDVSLPEGEVKVQQPEMEIKAPELEAEYDKEGSAQGSKFKLPKFGIALPKAKGPEVDLNASQKDVDITLPEVKAEVKLPEAEVKESSASTETEAKSKDVGGSPLKFKIPTLKMPKFGGVTYDVTLEAPDAGKAETDGAKLKEDVALNIKGPSVDIKTDMSKATISDTETPKTETEGAGHGSPSKFKLPSFKMPRLSFSRPKPEDEHTPGDNEAKGDQQEMEVEQREGTKSPKLSLTSFGEILKSIDVEFDVPKTDKGEENLETLKEAHETSEPSGKQLEAKEKETTTKQDTTKSPERTGWFKFPKFGLSSPSEPAKISEKDEHKDEKSPAGETGEEDISPTCSVQSSDAFADVSSTITSEHVGLSLSSPTKVTVKYSDPNEATGLGEIKSNIITSTTRTGLISFEPNVPEKITILSSGVSSSSEDTLKLESGKIHVITTNIQATPEAQHAKLLTAVQVQPAASLPLTSGANEAASWTVEESQGGKRTVFERRLVRETSSERSESQGTIVITKQITHIIDSSEPISGETASSIQRLRETVHSEKMRFFDGAEK